MGNPFPYPAIPAAAPATIPADGADRLRALLDAAEQELIGGTAGTAELRLSRALALDPANPRALGLAGGAAHLSGRFDRALLRFGWAARLAPGNAAARNGLSEVLRRQGRLDEALRHGRLAAALAPEWPDALYNLGITHYERQEVDSAILCERRAIRLAPSAPGPHFELAEGLLLSGRLEEGWQEYEWRFRLPGVPAPVPPELLAAGRLAPRPQWDGRPQPGRLLLVADQGFGDVIQFARYIPMAERLCPDLVVAASPEMMPVLGQLIDDRRLHQEWDQLPEFDCWCPLSGLPRLFGTGLSTIPAEIPYLHADGELAAWWKERLDGVLPKGMRRIGLAWAGRPSHGNDHNRSMRLRRLAALSEIDGIALVSLQLGPAQADIGRYFGRAPLANPGPEIADFHDTMAILQGLDGLVSVDTAVAHLAGAMGVPVWLLLPYAPDWRWLRGRPDSPWYPTFRLFRQPAPGDWQGVIGQVAAAIAALAST
ncbi:tetratricopeptide repeat protein [Azospirillum picis]|uniref:Tfp pilus assembly protein PilF n=1 Tax=Azospirillum picis TaxID=488438 RepID=A0ABU0MMU7_9PROT|nr:tetratricopeptide repeat protein [Azospirillum picis]MBP2303586.1 Tfp pilus assembly protein PilF [Azospirillum picis]MDQ0534787.1 Tfp pilus assembly protein PilF [Azospirillum picis]